MIKNKLQKMENRSITVATIEKILNYLGTKPYVEVESLIRSLIEEANSEDNKNNSESREFKVATLEKVLSYLGTKAFIEVESLIKAVVTEATKQGSIEQPKTEEVAAEEK